LAKVSIARELNIIDLTDGRHLRRVKADARLCTGDDYEVTQKWSLSFWNHPSEPDGVQYNLRHDHNRIGVALYSRNTVVDSITAINMGTFLDRENVDKLNKILKHYKFSLL
jgi:hypothetical protein